MPICLRCERLGSFSSTEGWKLMSISHNEYVHIYNDREDIRLRPDTVRSELHTVFLGLCPRCQLSEAQIENLKEDE
jgi:hypothetical protein